MSDYIQLPVDFGIDEYRVMEDFCLLLQDEQLSYENQLGTFMNDQNNPCFMNPYYLEITQSRQLEGSWDCHERAWQVPNTNRAPRHDQRSRR